MLHFPQSEDGTVNSKPGKVSPDNTDKPNGSPKNALSNVAAVATLMKGDPHNYL